MGAESFTRDFWLKRSPRGHGWAGVRGTSIRVLRAMDDETKRRAQEEDDTAKANSLWRRTLDALGGEAEVECRRQWKARSGEARR